MRRALLVSAAAFALTGCIPIVAGAALGASGGGGGGSGGGGAAPPQGPPPIGSPPTPAPPPSAPPPSSPPPSTGAGGGGSSGSNVAVASIANPGTGSLGGVLICLVFTASAPSGTSPALASVRVSASGSVKDDATLTRLSLIRDVNQDGRVDVADANLVSATPAFTANDGTTTLTPPQSSLSNLPPGGSAQFILTLETIQPVTPTTASETAIVGSSVTLTIPSTADLTFSQGATTTGAFPLVGTPVTLGAGDHLLISEVSSTAGAGNTSSEFVEVFNPTSSAIDLSRYYLTDFTEGAAFSATNKEYYKLPTGDLFGPPGDTNDPIVSTSTDFFARFPAGAIIAPGEFLVIAVDGAGFSAAYPGVLARFVLRRAQSGSTLMRIWDGVAPGFNFVSRQVNDQVGLTDSGEQVFLVRWDDASDLVQDVDIVEWGSASATNVSLDKSPPGIPGIDGPDTGAATTAFKADTAAATQDAARASAPGTTSSMQRSDYREGAEAKTAGNGIAGHDETSEPWNSTFTNAGPTPRRF